ncbi:MAG TPA: NUDIX domain-containing protein [Acidimicrobiia bacterium]
MREWLVASALVEVDGALLLVRNERRGGFSDWSTPGGVIDADDRSVLTGLTREVEEETGLRVTDWEGPVYKVRAVAQDMGWRLHAEVYRALAFEGELRVADPDGIVVEAVFVEHPACADRLADGARWVREPLSEWIAERWEPEAARGYTYDVRGTRRGDLAVHRTSVAAG